jgi:hypothetical protein
MARETARVVGWSTAAVLLTASPFAAGAAGTTQIDDQMVALTATFQGTAASQLGSSREWYAPSSGLFRVERSWQGRRTVAVYDGRTLTHAQEGVISRATGSRAFVLIAAQTSRRPIFSNPAIVVYDAYRTGGATAKALRIRASNGGKVLDATLSYQGENAPKPAQIPIRVVRTGELLESAARSSGLLTSPRGRVVGETHQAPAGAHPSFGEPGFWFGSTLGRARALTTIEKWGADGVYSPSPVGAYQSGAAARRQATYETVYRLPSAAVNGLHLPRPSDSPFPGLGVLGPRDIWVQCFPSSRGLPGLQPNTKGTPITITGGRHAMLYVQTYTQGSLDGIWADIVVGKSVCYSQGLISEREFRRLARTLRPV